MIPSFNGRSKSAAALSPLVAFFAATACSAASLPRFELTQLSDNGGRLAWYTGSAHELIAYDAIVDRRTAATEVFVMRADGSGVRCVTCAMNFSKGGGFVGQPSWHPDGEHMVIQVENGNSGHTRFNHMSWRIDADLWIIGLDGRRADRTWRAPASAATARRISGASSTLRRAAPRSVLPSVVEATSREAWSPIAHRRVEQSRTRVRVPV